MFATTNTVRSFFIDELKNSRFVVDKTGVRTIELLGASFTADFPTIFGEPNDDYIDRELLWYDSLSTNINDIYGGDRAPPKAWEYSANEHGEINSNYGLLLYSPLYHSQYDNLLVELLRNPNTRRATAIYNRPEIWREATANGKNDFICTNAVTYYIREQRLHCVVQMRSNDVIYGYNNDYAWQEEVLLRLTDDYNIALEANRTVDYAPITAGEIVWQVQSLHVYEKHFDLVY